MVAKRVVGGCLIRKSKEGRGEKRDVGGCPIGKSSRSDGSERCG